MNSVWSSGPIVIQTMLMRTGCHFYIPHYKSCLPTEVLHNLCFSFLPGIAVISIQIEKIAYAKVGGHKQGALQEMCKWRISDFNLGQAAVVSVVATCTSPISLLIK